jgi:hypothetical protein
MDSEHAGVLPLGERRLIPGVEYRVVAEFRDDLGAAHPVGERWVFLGFEQPRLYPGYVLHVRESQGFERSFRLRENGVLTGFDSFVVGPIVETPILMSQLRPEAQAAFRRVRRWLPEQLPAASDALIGSLLRAASHAGVAYGRGDEDALSVTVDLQQVVAELELELRNHRA